jgi:hypothetical protein
LDASIASDDFSEDGFYCMTALLLVKMEGTGVYSTGKPYTTSAAMSKIAPARYGHRAQEIL